MRTQKIIAVLLALILCGSLTTARAADPDCPARPVRISGGSLAPLVAPESSLPMIPAACAATIARGALVIFRSGAHEQPLIKIVKAVPGDRFGIAGGRVTVNGAVLANSAGTPYQLGEGRARMIASYAASYGGIVPADAYLVLGDDPAGTIDSSRIGLVNRRDIVMVGPADE
ncbi:MAG: signal peptidase I [Spartobacteria bacterium]|nr:signal peptidase I [Spartobacteria bacterium]